MRIWECDMCHERFDKELNTLGFDGIRVWDICPDCIKSVTDFVTGKYNDKLKKLVEKAKEPVEPRKTCNTCVHFMVAKSRCLKKRLPIRANDKDACDDWSSTKTCENCKWYSKPEGCCVNEHSCHYGSLGRARILNCGKWES